MLISAPLRNLIDICGATQILKEKRAFDTETLLISLLLDYYEETVMSTVLSRTMLIGHHFHLINFENWLF